MVNSWESNVKYSLMLLTFGRIGLGRANDIAPFRARISGQFRGNVGVIFLDKRRIFEIRVGVEKSYRSLPA
jgi:hypothetical protein